MIAIKSWKRRWAPFALACIGVVGIGCADRVESIEDEDLPENVQNANLLIAAATEAMERAGVHIDFDDIGALRDLQSQLPAPDSLASASAQTDLQEGITSFNGVFSEMNIALDPMDLRTLEAPQQDSVDVVFDLSPTDETLLHVYLSYLYTMEAVSRLAQVGDDLFKIEFVADVNSASIYKFEMLRDVSGMTPDEILGQFDVQQRQAVVDALRVLTGGVIAAGGQRPAIDESVFQRAATFHVFEAGEQVTELSVDLQNAIRDLQDAVETNFTVDLLRQIAGYGFTIEQLPPRLAVLIETQLP
ncbi:MAG: hypothetical protein O3A46_01895 [Candidatus Poribacteria bacterium]|nr:hypothetical protein [Candidatus Poribacteria bacterium]